MSSDHLSVEKRIDPGKGLMSDCDALSSSYCDASQKTGLAVILIARTALHVPLRLSYFFLPAITRGLAVPLSAGGTLVSTGSLMGLVAPLFGVLSDRSGGRRVMVFATGLSAVGALLTAGLPWYGVGLVTFGLMGLAKMAFDPAMQVFFGERVPYKRRGRALGLAELAWSLSLLAMPVCGWLIDAAGWRTPFLLLGAAGVPVCWLTRRALPPDAAADRESPTEARDLRRALTSLVDSVRQVWRDRQSRLALTATALIAFAQVNVLVVYGAWMEDGFGLTVTNLGAVTLVIGAAELVAELAVAFVSDRFGKRRSVFVSVIFTGLAYLALPRLTGSLGAALVGSAVMTFFFEFTIVGLLPLVSGMNADARGTLMSLSRAAGSASRVIAAPVGVAVYAPGDIGVNGPISALACLLLLLVLLRLRERGQ
jgi:predicted MFS family arabinose efflux permease